MFPLLSPSLSLVLFMKQMVLSGADKPDAPSSSPVVIPVLPRRSSALPRPSTSDPPPVDPPHDDRACFSALSRSLAASFLSESLLPSLPSHPYYPDIVDPSLGASSDFSPLLGLDLFALPPAFDRDTLCSAWRADWEDRPLPSPSPTDRDVPPPLDRSVLLVRSGKGVEVSGDSQRAVNLNLTLPCQLIEPRAPSNSSEVCFYVGNQLVDASPVDGLLRSRQVRPAEKRDRTEIPQYEFSLEEKALKRLCARFYTLPSNAMIPTGMLVTHTEKRGNVETEEGEERQNGEMEREREKEKEKEKERENGKGKGKEKGKGKGKGKEKEKEKTGMSKEEKKRLHDSLSVLFHSLFDNCSYFFPEFDNIIGFKTLARSLYEGYNK